MAKSELENALLDTIYLQSGLVRMKHTLAARREVRAKVEALRKEFYKNVQKGIRPVALTPAEVEQALDLKTISE